MKIRMIFLFVVVFCLIPFALAENHIEIDELELSFKIPKHIEWATRTEGNYAIMEETYHMDQENLIAYMERGDEYFKGVDPNTDLRVLLTTYPANRSEKNYSNRTDDELIQAISGDGIGDNNDISVYNTTHTKFIQIRTYTGGQIYNVCQTCIDGKYYMFNVRGTNEGYIETMSAYLMETFYHKTFDIPSENNLLPVSFSGISILIPETWEQADLSFNSDVETTSFFSRGTDGLLRYITCNVIDVCKSSGSPDILRAYMSGDQYSEQMAIFVGGQQNIQPEEIEKYTYNGKNYYGFIINMGGVPGIRLCIVENGYLYVFVFETDSTENLFEDELFPIFEDVIESVVFLS